MDMQLLLPSLGVFMAIICAAGGVLFVAKAQVNRRLRNRLEDVIILGEGQDSAVEAVILRDMDLSSFPFLNELLKNSKWATKLDNLLVQADVSMKLGTFLGLQMIMGAGGALAMFIVFQKPLWALPVGVALYFAPLIWLRNRKTKRIRMFEKQFPDALDMLTNALRAGLALTGAIQVVAEESPDPVAREFAIISEENRLGLDLRDALKKLGARIDSAELRLFVTAVILQRETGGNLAEILEGTAAVIRDRFRILGDVRSMTAHARLSGMILTFLPLVMAGIIMFVAPDYLKGLFADPMGRFLAIGAVFLQISGYLIMRKLVDIKV